MALVGVIGVVVGLGRGSGLQLLHARTAEVVVGGSWLLACLLRVVGVFVEIGRRVDILGAAEDGFLDVFGMLCTQWVRVGHVLAHALELPVLCPESLLGVEGAVVLVVGSDGDVVEAAVGEHPSECFSAILDHGLGEVTRVGLGQVLLAWLLLTDHS